MKTLNDKKILDSWSKNAAPWAKAIHQKQIESRRLVTDQAIIETVSAIPATRVLDIGCGEGWLVRELSKAGMTVTGIDATQDLVNTAERLGGGAFHLLEYEQLSSWAIKDKYDIAVCNFSLLGKESVEHVFNAIPSILNQEGHFVVQTLHPVTSCGNLPYADGWRTGSWAGFSDDFRDPAPWYFRTTESWFNLFRSSGLTLQQVQEPINTETGKAASLIMVGSFAC